MFCIIIGEEGGKPINTHKHSFQHDFEDWKYMLLIQWHVNAAAVKVVKNLQLMSSICIHHFSYILKSYIFVN